MRKQQFPVEAFGHDERSTQFATGGHCDTLINSDYKQPIIVAYAIENHPCDSRVTMTDNGIVQTLSARIGTGGNNTPFVLIQNPVVCFEPGIMSRDCSAGNRAYINLCSTLRAQMGDNQPDVLRRLTPMECLRLQGLPDWWVDGVQGSDSAIYKMAGNGLAIPCATFVIGRIAEEIMREE